MSTTEKWNIEQYKRYLETGQAPSPNHSAVQAPEPKPNHEHARLRAAKNNQLDKRVCIEVTLRGRRPWDADDIDCKAAIDGIRKSGLLRNDSPKEVAEVRLKPEITQTDDETVIDVYELE